MSFLSGDRFAARPSGSGPPTPVRILRVLLWIQAAIGLVLGALVLWSTYQQQRMSDSQLASVIKDQLGDKAYREQFGERPPTQEIFDYPLLYAMAALLVVLMIAVIWSALRVAHRVKRDRIITVVIQAVLVLASFWTLQQLGCVLILPAIAVITLLMSRQSKDWYESAST